MSSLRWSPALQSTAQAIQQGQPVSQDDANALAQDIANNFLDIVGRTRLSINLPELLTTLSEEKLIIPFSVKNAQYVPVLTQVSFLNTTPFNYVSYTSQIRWVVGADHVFTMQYLVDNQILINDPDVVQQTYQAPVDFLGGYNSQFYPSYQSTDVVVFNNSTTNPEYFSYLAFGFIAQTPFWNALVANYFKVILGEIGLNTGQVAPVAGGITAVLP